MSHRLVRAAISLVAAGGVTSGLLVANADGSPAAQARPDFYQTRAGTTLTVGGDGVLANDTGGVTTIVDDTQPAHGTLRLDPDGSFSYTPMRVTRAPTASPTPPPTPSTSTRRRCHRWRRSAG